MTDKLVVWSSNIWKEIFELIVFKGQPSDNTLTLQQASTSMLGCWVVGDLLDRVTTTRVVIKYRTKHDINGIGKFQPHNRGLIGHTTPGEASPFPSRPMLDGLGFRQWHCGLQKTIILHSESWESRPENLRPRRIPAKSICERMRSASYVGRWRCSSLPVSTS